MWLIQAELKERKKKKNHACFSLSLFLSLFFATITLIVFEQRCIYVNEILCLDMMQSRGQLQLTRLQLNVLTLICACRARTRAYVSGLDKEYKRRKEKLRIEPCFRHKKKNVSIFFFLRYYRKKNKNECVIITLRWCV